MKLFENKEEKDMTSALRFRRNAVLDRKLSEITNNIRIALFELAELEPDLACIVDHLDAAANGVCDIREFLGVDQPNKD